jgi:hypothetical protein
LPRTTRKTLKEIHRKYGLTNLRHTDVEDLSKLSEEVQRQVLIRATKILKKGNLQKNQTHRDVLKFCIKRAATDESKKHKTKVFRPGGITTLDEIEEASLPTKQIGNSKSSTNTIYNDANVLITDADIAAYQMTNKQKQESQFQYANRLSQPRQRVNMESPDIPKRREQKGKTNFIARNRTKAAKTTRRARASNNNNNNKSNDRQGNPRRKYHKSVRSSGYGNAYQQQHRVPTPPDANTTINGNNGYNKYNNKQPLKEAMGSHHSQVMPGWYYSPRINDQQQQNYVTPGGQYQQQQQAGGQYQQHQAYFPPPPQQQEEHMAGMEWNVERQQQEQQQTMQLSQAASTQQFQMPPNMMGSQQQQKAYNNNYKYSLSSSGHTNNLANLTNPNVSPNLQKLSEPKQINTTHKKKMDEERQVQRARRRQEIKQQQKKRNLRNKKQLKIKTNINQIDFTSVGLGEEKNANNGGYVNMGRKHSNSPKPILLMSPKEAPSFVLPPPAYPPPVINSGVPNGPTTNTDSNVMYQQHQHPNMTLNASYNNIGTYQYQSSLPPPPQLHQQQQIMMSNGNIFPPPVPVAPVYIQPNIVGGNGIITERPFRPPPQPPDFSGVILFTNGEPVAMYNSGGEQ